MSEKKQQAPTIDPSKLFEGGDEVTGEQLLEKQYVSDENLLMKTDIKDPMVIAGMKVLAHASEHEGYNDVKELLDCAVDSFLEAMVSHKREGRKEFKESWVALMETNMRKKEGLADQIFGGSR